MTEDQLPPTPLPPASEPPYPAHPAPHPHAADTPAESKSDESTPAALLVPLPPAAMGTLGVTLIGGAVAAAVGMLIAIPLLRRKKAPASPAPKRKPAARRPTTRRKSDR